MKKKVCHITSCHNRHDVRIYFKECISLAKNGYDVTLIVNDDINDENSNNIKIVSSKIKPKNRIERFLLSRKLLLKKALEINADLYHLHDPDLLPLGNKLKSLGKKVVFDSHEDIPKQIIEKTWIPKILRGSIARIYALYEKYSLKKYDAVITVTPNIVKRLEKININTVMITNYPIIKFSENKYRKNFSRSICFAGGITPQWRHELIIKSLEKISDIEYILAGSGDKKYIDFLKSLPGWNKVRYLGKVPFKEIRNIYSQSIAGMALNYSNQVKGEGTLGNTKLFEYMEAGIPVICSNYKLWKEIIENYKCGICVNPNSVEEITKAINYLVNNPKEAQKMGKNGQKAVFEKYNWKTQEKILLDLYNKL